MVSLLLLGCQAQNHSDTEAEKQAENPTSIQDRTDPHGDVSVQEAQNMIASGEVIILDVRTDDEFNEGHIEGARQLNFFSDNFKEKIAELPRDANYLVYCASGNRSGKAVQIMKELNFIEVHNMEGGISAWRSNSLETVR